MIRVVIADDSPIMRAALRLLMSTKKVKIVGEARDGKEAVDCVKRLQPDVLVMDIRMPVLNGMEATKQIAELSVPTRVILISSYRGSQIASRTASVGAQGFVPKDLLATLLFVAIKTVYRGERFFTE